MRTPHKHAQEMHAFADGSDTKCLTEGREVSRLMDGLAYDNYGEQYERNKDMATR